MNGLGKVIPLSFDESFLEFEGPFESVWKKFRKVQIEIEQKTTEKNPPSQTSQERADLKIAMNRILK